MPISHIIHVLLPIPTIPPTPLPNRILSPQSEKEHRTRDATKQEHSEGDAVAERICGSLRREEDVGGNYAAEVTYADLEGGGDGAFVVAADVLRA